jgi:hypothetical protein
MKAFIWFLLLFGLAVIWHRYNARHPSRSNSPSAPQWTSSKLVIDYNTMSELLDKLRQIKTYKEVEIRHVGPPVQIAVACNDIAGRRAYEQSQDAIGREVGVELQRISDLPH